METLTLRQLLELAPGAVAVGGIPRLLNTQAWLMDVADHGFKPVFAMQGSSHEDGGDPKLGRHLVVAARPDGVALTLLNSHCRLQRVWAGLGLWHNGELLLAHALAVQRWKGASVQVEQLLTCFDPIDKVSQNLIFAAPNLWGYARAVAEKIAAKGYIGGRGRPSVAALVSAIEGQRLSSRQDVACALVATARRGNLAPAGKDKSRRNVKGIRRPDAYQHLALAAWKAAIEVAK